jgi:glycogen operon protein
VNPAEAAIPEPPSPGLSFPLGSSLEKGGVNFSCYSKHATGAELCLFDHVDAVQPSRVLRLDSRIHRTYHYWHLFVPGLKAGQLYGYRMQGPFDPRQGHRFDPERILLDPYGKAVVMPSSYDRDADAGQSACLKSVVTGGGDYDWEGDLPLRQPFLRSVIYELHVSGFTRDPSSGLAPQRRGTYAGLIDKIPYLQELGVSAVELLPVFAFDPQDAPAGRVNYWGYSPLSFFAPHPGYSSRRDPLGPVEEFRDMVKALHRAGIEVILDVVYNHTAEGGEGGPTLCFRGLANDSYYILGEDRSVYANYSGCGNTLNAHEPICRRLILDSLRHWVREMHVDGFRFDLASILSRDEKGRPLASAPILWEIESDPVLCNVKLIAEAWDAGGLYQVGSFVGDSWVEWNGRFRDDVRSFMKGDSAKVGAMAARLLGSPDLYEHEEREAEQSINFITCHDGFTLNDLVCYNHKHNEANGENNRDGSNDNLSWNCGIEGPTDDPEIDRLRQRMIRNLLTLNLLSVGTPMLLMGDEVRRTQHGNNNAYCQDNGTSWFDWNLVSRNQGLHRFVRKLIALHRNRELADERNWMSLNELLQKQTFEWHGVQLDHPDWGEDSHSLAARVQIHGTPQWLHLMINAYWKPLIFEITPPAGLTAWRRCIDTSLASPQDIQSPHQAPVVADDHYRVESRSVVLLSGSSVT